MSSNRAGMAVYQQVAEAIRDDIRHERLRVGERLPGNRSVADKYEVALGTAQKAIAALEAEGWVTRTPSVGVFVNEPPDGVSDTATVEGIRQRLANVEATVVDLARRVEKIEAGTE